MDFQYEDTYAPYERIATSSGTGQGNAGFADLTGTAPKQVSPDSGPEPLAGAVAGFLGAAVVFGVANLSAAFVRPQASPITAVGGALEHFAVQKFGENNQNMVVFGVYFTIALLAMAIGMVAWQRVWVGVLGMGLFGLVGAYIAVTRPGSQATDALPPIVGGIAAMAALVGLIHAGTRWIGYETPGYEPPGYEPPSYETPLYESAAHESPGYGTPAYETPVYETVSFGAPGYETASYETPGYEFSASETPTYESATYRTTGRTS